MTVEAIAIAFSGVVLLALLKVTVESRDQVRTIHQALFGVPGEVVPTGLVSRVRDLGINLDEHCRDERNFWDEVTSQRETLKQEVIDATTAVMGDAQLNFAERIDGIARDVQLLAERRFGKRP